MFPSRAPFFRDRLSARGVATAANAEARGVACDVAEEAVPALPAWPLPQRGNLPVSPFRPFHRSSAKEQPMSVARLPL